MKRLKIYRIVIILGYILCNLAASGQDYFSSSQRQSWQQKAMDNIPVLSYKVSHPVTLVQPHQNRNAFQGWELLPVKGLDNFYGNSFKGQSGTILDFGTHVTGYVTFSLATINSTADAPIRLKMTFVETPAEASVSFDNYKGSLSRAWLQDETITVTEFPATITIPRRVSFRFVKIELLGASPYFDFRIADLMVKSSTSAGMVDYSLAPTTPSIFKSIDSVGVRTLSECMQTVFEDGPKRDHRLWLGDLYLQSLANQYTFKQFGLTKRCLYLLASLSRPDGYLCSNVFESPIPHNQERAPLMVDYSLLFNAVLKNYYIDTKDLSTVLDLWPVAKKQLENIYTSLDKKNLFDPHYAQQKGWFPFIDWSDSLDKTASVQGLMIFSLKETYELAKMIGKEKEVSDIPTLVDKMVKAAKEELYDKNSGMFISGPQHQLSYASQAWMVLAEVTDKKTSRKILTQLKTRSDVLKPGTPYLYHYYVQALINSGMDVEAKEMVEDYWGGMVKKGADTFWEVYDPHNDQLSPYGFYPINSYCHAWSCTAIYFIRKYPQIFQK